MKIIKLNEEHYIICDDSEIKEGDFMYNPSNNSIEKYSELDQKYWDDMSYGCKKITHSTQPLKSIVTENSFKSYEFIPLQEVKELIGEKVDLKKVAEERFWKWNGRDWEDHEVTQIEKGQYVSGFVSGYKQALEDNKERKYTEEDMLNALYSMWYKAKDGDFNIKEAVKASIDYVQPKNSWEVEWEICETYKLDECNSRFACCNKPKKLKLK